LNTSIKRSGKGQIGGLDVILYGDEKMDVSDMLLKRSVTVLILTLFRNCQSVFFHAEVDDY